MTNFLSREATQDYFLLTLRSYHYAIIDEQVFLERLAVLSSLGDRAGGATVFANEILEDHDWFNDCTELTDDWLAQEESGLSDSHGERSAEESSDGDPDDFVVHLIIAVEGISWDFHPFDDDWFPAVPHGHKRPGKSTDKLDPYLGWIYDKSKQSGRLKRKAIISLWNDDRFRETASRAIDYYLHEHPHYRGWRVSNPRRLPRRK